MARLSYTVTTPDGVVHTRTTADHCEHTVAVVGYMRLRKPLPKLNPEDPHEEIRYDRFKAWVLIGTSENQRTAERLAACQGYKNVTEEVRYIPVQGVLVKKHGATSHIEDDEEGLVSATPVQAVNLDDI